MAEMIINFNRWASITKSDTVDIPEGITDSIHCGGAGVVVAVSQDGTTGAFTVVAGQRLDVKAKRVNSTSTTATLLMALYQA